MNKKKILLYAFVFVAAAQLFVPGQMIFIRHQVLVKGNEYKFKTAPIDPNDPFRGKYITLRYDDNTATIENEADWERDEKLYVEIMPGKDGFAKIKSIYKEKPSVNADYFEAVAGYVSGNGDNEITIDYPFDRFYMEESKAYDAEQTYRQSRRDTTKVTYALVNIYKGEAVLKDVMINGLSIIEIVKAKKEAEGGN